VALHLIADDDLPPAKRTGPIPGVVVPRPEAPVVCYPQRADYRFRVIFCSIHRLHRGELCHGIQVPSWQRFPLCRIPGGHRVTSVADGRCWERYVGFASITRVYRGIERHLWTTTAFELSRLPAAGPLSRCSCFVRRIAQGALHAASLSSDALRTWPSKLDTSKTKPGKSD